MTLVRHGSVDASLGLDKDNDFVEAVEEARKESRTKRPLMISVSSAFVNVSTDFEYYVVILPKPGKTFYMKAEHWQNLFSVVHKKRMIMNPNEDGAWIDTVSFIRVRDQEYGEESKWRKTTNGNTIDLIYFVHGVPIGEEETFGPLLEKRIKYFFDVSYKRKTNITGKAALNYVRNLPSGSTGGLGKFCLNKGGGDADKAATIMTDEIDAHFKDGYELLYDVPLNKFMVDWDIKRFLQNYLRATSWEDLSEDDKKKCFRDYPRKSLPDWGGIAQESF